MLQKLFTNELHFFLPSILYYGELYLPGNKLSIINELVTPCHNSPDSFEEYNPQATMIIDGGRLPYQYTPKSGMTFMQYAESIFKILELFFSSTLILFCIFPLKIPLYTKFHVDRPSDSDFNQMSCYVMSCHVRGSPIQFGDVYPIQIDVSP